MEQTLADLSTDELLRRFRDCSGDADEIRLEANNLAGELLRRIESGEVGADADRIHSTLRHGNPTVSIRKGDRPDSQPNQVVLGVVRRSIPEQPADVARSVHDLKPLLQLSRPLGNVYQARFLLREFVDMVERHEEPPIEYTRYVLQAIARSVDSGDLKKEVGLKQQTAGNKSPVPSAKRGPRAQHELLDSASPPAARSPHQPKTGWERSTRKRVRAAAKLTKNGPLEQLESEKPRTGPLSPDQRAEIVARHDYIACVHKGATLERIREALAHAYGLDRRYVESLLEDRPDEIDEDFPRKLEASADRSAMVDESLGKTPAPVGSKPPIPEVQPEPRPGPKPTKKLRKLVDTVRPFLGSEHLPPADVMVLVAEQLCGILKVKSKFQ